MLESPKFDVVNKARHYNLHPSGIECVQIARQLGFDLGNAVKYVWREDLKNGRQDYEKAEYYLKDLIVSCDRASSTVPTDAQKLLLQVADAEEIQPSPNAAERAAYFRAVAGEDPEAALGILRVLLHNTDPGKRIEE